MPISFSKHVITHIIAGYGGGDGDTERGFPPKEKENNREKAGDPRLVKIGISQDDTKSRFRHDRESTSEELY